MWPQPRWLNTCMALACVTMLASACGTARHADRLQVDVRDDVVPDSMLVRDERTLFDAAMRHSVPGGEAYDVERAVALFEAFIGRYPASDRRREVAERLALLHEIQALRLELQGLKDIDLKRRPWE